MVKDSKIPIKSMVVDGGMTVNNTLLQIQSDFMNADIVRKQEKEITSIGAAIAAGLQVKFWGSLEDVESKIQIDRIFTPAITDAAREAKMKRWS
jgi:glycerol kinase